MPFRPFPNSFQERSSALAEGQITLGLDGEEGEDAIKVRLKPNPRAKRLILRLDPRSGEPVATIPPGLSERKIKAFLEANRDWLVARQEARAEHIPFTAGATIPVRDIPHELCHVGQKRGTVRLLVEGGRHRLMVSGDEAHFARRVTDWLKKQAREDLSDAVDCHAKALDVKPSSIRIKDTTSRWGSCSSARVLSFSWRIIFAPPFVLNYLAAHEVAHLREMNHSPRFWAHVEDICPDFEEAKVWLKQYGRDLHAYGAP
ncbi:MAG: M48 family metallopeptidase [Cohaesibacter sp.]|jgi:predicted metal-dependent hydrolase|nr:M48 family metallopeptidase [Cohaesibacter sp.]